MFKKHNRILDNAGRKGWTNQIPVLPSPKGTFSLKAEIEIIL
jgi:hypothetical protein